MGHENEVEPPRRCVGFAKKKAKKKTKGGKVATME
jgi:hypothetical protein